LPFDPFAELIASAAALEIALARTCGRATPSWRKTFVDTDTFGFTFFLLRSPLLPAAVEDVESLTPSPGRGPSVPGVDVLAR
jgi:hypothetical protein